MVYDLTLRSSLTLQHKVGDTIQIWTDGRDKCGAVILDLIDRTRVVEAVCQEDGKPHRTIVAVGKVF